MTDGPSRSRRRERDELERYHGDAVYEAWASGRNPDYLDHDRLTESFDRDESVESAVRGQYPERQDEEP